MSRKLLIDFYKNEYICTVCVLLKADFDILSRTQFSEFYISENVIFANSNIPTLVRLFRQIETILKDSTAFVYVTKSVESCHLCKMT